MKRSAVQIRFPIGGVTRRTTVQDQAPYTCYDALNVFPDDPFLERERGGSRPPMKSDITVSAGEPIRLIKEFGYVTGSQVRKQVLMVVCDGALYEIEDTTAVSKGTGLETDKYVTGCAINGKFYVAGDDSSSRVIKVYDPNGSYGTLTASSGTIPTKVRTIARWRDRLLAVSETDPWVLRMSKQGDPTNWNYGSSGTDRAVDLSATEAGQLGHPITALIPRDDNVLIICTTVGFWEMRGDPTIGGRIYPLNEEIAILGPHAYCETPDGFLFVMTNDGLYVRAPGHGSPLYSVSREKIPKDLAHVDSDDYTISMCYDKKLRGVLVFVTEESASDADINPNFCGTMSQGSDPPAGASLLVTHFFVDVRNQMGQDNINRQSASFWPMSLQTSNEPTFAMAVNGFKSDQGSLYGTKGGKISYFERGATSTTITGGAVAKVIQGGGVGDLESLYRSYVVIGPIQLGGIDRTGLLEAIVGYLPKDSGEVEFDIYVGDDAETTILKASPDYSSSWDREGLNYREHPRLRGRFAWIVLRGASSAAWSFESAEIIRQMRGRNRVHYG